MNLLEIKFVPGRVNLREFIVSILILTNFYTVNFKKDIIKR